MNKPVFFKDLPEIEVSTTKECIGNIIEKDYIRVKGESLNKVKLIYDILKAEGRK